MSGMKTCRVCSKPGDKKAFAKNRATCRICVGVQTRAFRATSLGKTRRKGEHRRRLDRNYVAYRAIKRAMRCLFCGESEPCCIDFHHVRGSEKGRRAIPDSLINSTKSLITEIAKCVALCANCHRKIHFGHLKLPRHIKPISVEWLWSLVKP